MPLVRIRMIITMSGNRPDNRPWPPYKGEIDVDKWEADHLVGARIAEYITEPVLDLGWDVLRHPDPEFQAKMREALTDPEDTPVDGLVDLIFSEVRDEDADDDFDRRDDDSDFDRDEVELPKPKPMKRPVTTDTKAEWVKWAVQNGAEEKHALENTKAQLVAKYSKL